MATLKPKPKTTGGKCVDTVQRLLCTPVQLLRIGTKFGQGRGEVRGGEYGVGICPSGLC